MSFPVAGPSRYASLASPSDTGGPVSPSLSPMHEHPSWSAANGNGYRSTSGSANGHGDSEANSGRDESRDTGAKRNPLVDLIDSEKAYVDQLALVIRVSPSLVE